MRKNSSRRLVDRIIIISPIILQKLKTVLAYFLMLENVEHWNCEEVLICSEHFDFRHLKRKTSLQSFKFWKEILFKRV